MKIIDSPIFSSEKSFFSYIGGVFDAKGRIYIGQNARIGIHITGSIELIRNISQKLSEFSIQSSIQDSQTSFMIIQGENSTIFLKSIYNYVIFKKDQIEFALEHQKMISKIIPDSFDEWQKRQKQLLDNIKNKSETINIQDYTEEDWFFYYSIGFFDSKIKIKVNKKEIGDKTQYWLEVDIKTPYREFLQIASAIYGGHVIPIENSYKWSLFEDDAYKFLESIGDYLIEKKDLLILLDSYNNLFTQFEKYYSPELKDKIEEVRIKLKRGKLDNSGSSKSSNIPFLVCNELYSKLDKLKVELNISRSNLIRKALIYYLDNFDKAKSHEYKVCKNQPKKKIVGFSANNDLLIRIKSDMELRQINNRAELIRNAIEFYVDSQYLDEKVTDVSDSPKNTSNLEDPFDLLDILNEPFEDFEF